MRRVDLARPGAPSGDRARVARLIRHLKARLEDFGPGGPQVMGVDEASGTVTARFPGQDTGGVLTGWSGTGVSPSFRMGRTPCSALPPLSGLRTWTTCGARSSRCWAEIGSFPSSIPHLTGRAFGDIVRLSNEH